MTEIAMAAIDHEFTREVRAADRRPLPILDLGPYLSGDAAAAENLAQELREIAGGLGFMCVVNHGVSPVVLRDIQDQVTALFALPEQVKMAVKIDQHERGYLPFRSTVVRESRYHDKVQVDYYEAFNYGTNYDENDANVIAGTRLYGRNRWPDGVPDLPAAALAYSDCMDRLGRSLLPLWAQAFDLAPDYFSPFFEHAHGYVRPIHYPPKPELALDEYGLGAHSDTCFMTFLPRENEPGIQVMDVEGEWFWPDIPTDAIMVNFGQFLERWSNGFVRATPHRVIPPIKGHRYSLPFFFSPTLGQRCECLPTCQSADNPPQFEPMSFQEFHSWYMSRVYAHFEAFDEPAPES
jgi:isopenicillin N synthase-like dioxygenase